MEPTQSFSPSNNEAGESTVSGSVSGPAAPASFGSHHSTSNTEDNTNTPGFAVNSDMYNSLEATQKPGYSAPISTASAPQAPAAPSFSQSAATYDSYSSPLAAGTAANPVAVVRVLSPVGVEYVFMTICLFAAAAGLSAALLSLVNGQTSFMVLAFPTALLVITVPLFAALFLHTKKQEVRQPALKLDPSKRRSTQFSQIFSFIISLFTLVGLIFSVFSKLGGQSEVPVGKVVLDCLVLLVVFGGILAYYWHDEHRGK